MTKPEIKAKITSLKEKRDNPKNSPEKGSLTKEDLEFFISEWEYLLINKI